MFKIKFRKNEQSKAYNVSLMIKKILSNVTDKPGVYFMKNTKGKILYIGKAKNLKKRINSYSNLDRLSIRIKKMLSETFTIDYTITDHEASALLLEANLIKINKPKFNILMRDDKTYPHILIRKDHKWAQIIKSRGKKDKNGDYFGPFASAGAVNQTLNAMQRIFPLRTCNDYEFKNRTRPCIQHQIKRCTAPCVKLINNKEYVKIVEEAKSFLLGKNKNLQPKLENKMELAAKELNYEEAAVNRDRIRALNIIQNAQGADLRHLKDADVFAISSKKNLAINESNTINNNVYAIQVFFFRSGKNFGNRTHFIKYHTNLSSERVLDSFIPQFYDLQTPPPKILVSHLPTEKELIEKAFLIKHKKRIKIIKPNRGESHKAVILGITNAEQAIAIKISDYNSQKNLLKNLSKKLSLDTIPERIEVYDNSHFSGYNMIGAMIVTSDKGFEKNQYRKFNIKNENSVLKPGDDYKMISQVLERRFENLLDKNDDSFYKKPNLIIVDGGIGQCNSASKVLKKLFIYNVNIIGIAKGKKRNSGNEKIYFPSEKNCKPIILSKTDPTLYFIQRLRDEAHRFAISAQRAKSKKSLLRSSLDEIHGIGPKKRKSLILHFGSTNIIAQSSIDELAKAPGIEKNLAKEIYNYFNS